MGTPAASDSALAPGAGHGDEGDASSQGPAQEKIEKAQTEALPAQPKPAHAQAADLQARSEIEPKMDAVELKTETGSKVVSLPTPRETKKADVTVTSIAKPAKRKNAKERARDKMRNKTAEGGTRPDMTAKAKSKAEKAKVKRKSAAGKTA